MICNCLSSDRSVTKASLRFDTATSVNTLNIKLVFEHINWVLPLVLVVQHVLISGISNLEDLLTVVINQEFGL